MRRTTRDERNVHEQHPPNTAWDGVFIDFSERFSPLSSVHLLF
jgi:hypothetical protein